ncbi:hypothetical protein DPMN_170852 [Dreissena polymorpha]|uniref:Uncharacterized protein n=1 Tax=Dreissena polymorpha TaxID=45954 RepID=A0A9D4IDL1_DREPO|nr:hypothetical protein DPMN_170852 [Dreissena polymorpha]
MCFISRVNIIAVQPEDVREKNEELIVPGRIVRRAKRQTSKQTTYEGKLIKAAFCMDLRSFCIRMTCKALLR